MAHSTLPARELFLDLPSCLAPPQEADPLKVYPKLKGSFPENLKHLKRTMETLDWKVSSFPARSLSSDTSHRAGRSVRGGLGSRAWEARCRAPAPTEPQT